MKPQINNERGHIAVRNASDTAYAELRAASGGTDDNSVMTKADLDTALEGVGGGLPSGMSYVLATGSITNYDDAFVISAAEGYSLTVPTNTRWFIRCEVVGWGAGNSKVGSFTTSAIVKNVAGTVTITNEVQEHENNLNGVFTSQDILSVSGTSLVISIWAGSLAVCPVTTKVYCTIFAV
jgi:hypothetical protein